MNTLTRRIVALAVASVALFGMACEKKNPDGSVEHFPPTSTSSAPEARNCTCTCTVK